MSDKRSNDESKNPPNRVTPGQPRDIATQHVKEICYNQGNTGRKEPTHPEQQTAADIQRNSNDSQNVWIDMTVGEPAHHRVDDSLS